ncbi:MAG: hydroxysqualene dehydroxylase HpnE [Chloroflexota bacterium]|nr:hydroxysqualene dehydroxylase HpnE [Chloroflexota bacterium]
MLGGGLAGMAAACHLLDAGYAVTLVEKRPFLGGRAYSFTDAKTGAQVDNGQHVFLGCCAYYIEFLKKLGTLDKARLQRRLRVPVLHASGKAGVLYSVPLPAPFHLLPAFLRYPHLGWRDKLLGLYALAQVRFANRSSPLLANVSFYDWLKARRQSDHAIQNFWDLVVRPTANDDSRNVSASVGLMIFQEGLLKTRHGADMGYATVGLSELMGEPARDYIQARGGTLLLGRPATRLLLEDGHFKGVEVAGGETIRADWYVSALPFSVLKGLLPDSLAQEPFFSRLGQLTSAPIVDLHIWYDGPVLEEEFVAVLGSPIQWVFNRSRIQGQPPAGTGGQSGPGQYLCVSLSAAWEHIGQPKEALRETFTREMARVFPKAAQASIERFLVVKEERATFRALPGSQALRPPTVTPVPNLLLAGEWTDTGWPSTMEGAVRSGVHAARAIQGRRMA